MEVQANNSVLSNPLYNTMRIKIGKDIYITIQTPSRQLNPEWTCGSVTVDAVSQKDYSQFLK